MILYGKKKLDPLGFYTKNEHSKLFECVPYFLFPLHNDCAHTNTKSPTLVGCTFPMVF